VSLFLIPLAVIGEVIDASLGMMYGTLLAPLLIGIGYDPYLVVPSVLCSQALGGLVGTFRHQTFGNADFKGMTKHTKIALAIILPGLLAVFLGVFIALSIPSFYMKLYIGVLVIVMGILCLSRITYSFGWGRIGIIGFLSGFNKAFSGGGFGPVTSTGKILAGVDSKVSVATTTYAEVPICLAAFIVWLGLGGRIAWTMPLLLCIGAVIGALIGPYITYKLNTGMLRTCVGGLAVVAGIWVLVKLFT